ncbi:MAG: hypothetical protein N3F04_06070 [Candidatus Nezhaarchaeota archaeon]|nr:hypothetical protein [Candidatus Nezhaarchaeota archaeon]MCX8142307.1 hypothetical protein [Candidatus Nezhaarchaeota archaeon]MDW8050720.1 hypothetical protein [Nitrososphaerota archaeon]
MLKKSMAGSIVAFAILLAAILLSSASVVLASEPSIMVTVRAQAKGNDIVVSGKVFLSGVEGKIATVHIEIVVERPDGSFERATFKVSAPISDSGVTKLPYEYVFSDCINEGGFYKVKVIAKYKKLTDEATFGFDPPTGGTPGIPF